ARSQTSRPAAQALILPDIWSAVASEARHRLGIGELSRVSQSAVAAALSRRTPMVCTARCPQQNYCANSHCYGFIHRVRTGGEVIFLPGSNYLWHIGASKSCEARANADFI